MKYRIHKIRTDLLLPGTHDYWQVEYLSERDQWFHVQHTGEKTHRGHRILMEPHCAYNEAVAALVKLTETVQREEEKCGSH